jgi:hypothetical protein
MLLILTLFLFDQSIFLVNELRVYQGVLDVLNSFTIWRVLDDLATAYSHFILLLLKVRIHLLAHVDTIADILFRRQVMLIVIFLIAFLTLCFIGDAV